MVLGIERAIINLKMNKDQKKARHTLRDQRKALRPLGLGLGCRLVSMSWEYLSQTLRFQGCYPVTVTSLVLGEALPKSKGVFVKTGLRPSLCLKWASWAFSTLLGSQPQSCENPERFTSQI